MSRLIRPTSLLLASLALLLASGDRSAAKTFAVTINDPSSAASPILVGTSTAVTIDAGDSGPLTYTWSASGGAISGSGASVTWQAPGTAGSTTITCRVAGPSGSVG